MIFALAVGSRGSGSPAYSVRIPVTPAPDRNLAIGDGVCFAHEGVQIEIIRERNFYSVTAGEFSSEREARLWLDKMAVALNWMIIRFGLGLVFDSVPAGILLAGAPIPIAPDSLLADVTRPVRWEQVDGFYPADRTVVRPEHMKLIREEAGQPRIIIGVAADVVSAVTEAFAYPKHDALRNERKVLLAIQIYASCFFETRGPARFLTLMTALEALTEAAPRAKELRDCVSDFIDQLQSRRAELIQARGQQEFDSLVGSIRTLTEKSIAQKIKSLLQAALADTPEADLATGFGTIYGTRCRLVHQGISDQSEIWAAISELEKLVAAVLRYLFMRTVQPKEL